MVFSSLSFIFIFLFISVVLYFVMPSIKAKNIVLLLMSLIFYSWGEPKLLLLVCADCLIAFVCGFKINAANKNSNKKEAKLWLALATVLIVGFLIYYKYFGFITEILARLGAKIEIVNIALPIGISFFTFQILSYVIDLYREKVRLQRNYFKLLLYVSFFPQLIAGPIVRYGVIEDEIDSRSIDLDDAVYGTKRFILGLFKKVVIANGVAKIAEIIYSGMVLSDAGMYEAGVYGTAFYWLAAIAYTLQIYFDFSGYSDMAIGMGRIFGFHFDENFNYPYLSTSVQDFWSRWHISLSTFFRDYVYIPLGGNRVSKTRWIFNFMLIWFLTGLWHGAAYSFIIWGLYYGVILLAEKLISEACAKRRSKTAGPIKKFISWLYTMFVVTVGWVIFDLDDFAKLSCALRTLFTHVPSDIMLVVANNTDIVRALIYIPLGLICIFPLHKILAKFEEKNELGLAISNFVYLAMLALCICLCIAEKYNPFIYFRF